MGKSLKNNLRDFEIVQILYGMNVMITGRHCEFTENK